MIRFSRVYRLGSLLAAIVLGFALTAPASGFAAVPGGSARSAIRLPALPWSQNVTGTLTPVYWPGGLMDQERWYRISLAGGQTINVTATVAPGDSDFVMEARAASFSSAMYINTAISQNTTTQELVLKVMAPRTGDYYLNLSSEDPSAFSLDATVVPAVPYAIFGFGAPSKASRTKAFKVSIDLQSPSDEQPWYDGFLSPVRFIVEKRSAGGWKPISSARGKWTGNDDFDFTRFVGRLRLSKGKYRVRARYADAANPTPRYSSDRTIVVK